jgi:hypothetical protein
MRLPRRYVAWLNSFRWSAAVDSNHHPYEDARAKQEFESFLGRRVRIAAASNMWGSVDAGAATSRGDDKCQTGSGTGIRTLNLAVNRSLRPVQK